MHLNLEFYSKLYLIRKAEERICELYSEDDMKSPMHMSMGEEAIAVGVCHALDNGQIFGTYRSHAIYLAKTNDTDNFFTEMYGKDYSFQKGKCGSMHLCSPEHGFIGTSAIVGSTIPVAVGASYANKKFSNGKIVAVFFGDGAIDEGCFWESINLACLMKLPILFICENNGLAVHTSETSRHGYNSISDIISKFNCNVFKSSTTDVEEIYNLTCDAVNLMKENSKPCFINLDYYRYLEHVGVNKDFDYGYRTEDEFKKWYNIDPINLQKRKLLDNGYEKEVEQIEITIDNKINNSIKLAKESLFPNKSELYKNVYYEKD